MRDAAIDTHRSPARGARSRAAAVPSLDDMAGDGPVSRVAPRRGDVTSAAVAAQRLGGGRAARGRRAPGLVERLRARVPRVRPLKVLTVGAFGVALVGIVANAMVFQRGHHPSPLFGLGRSADAGSDAAARTAAAVPPPAAPAPVENTGAIAPAPATPATLTPPASATAAPAPKPVHHASKLNRAEAAPAKAKPAEVSSAPITASAHPRPGHAVVAKHDGKAEDPIAKLLGAGHTAKPEATKSKAADAAAPRPRHHVATTAGEAKPATKTE